jgi:hypothetical protein
MVPRPGSTSKGDYAIKSDGEDKQTGVRLHVIFSDPKEALQLAKKFEPGTEERHLKRNNDRAMHCRCIGDRR